MQIITHPPHPATQELCYNPSSILYPLQVSVSRAGFPDKQLGFASRRVASRTVSNILRLPNPGEIAQPFFIEMTFKINYDNPVLVKQIN